MTNFGDFRLTVFGQFNPTLTEQIEQLKEETKKLQKLYKQTTEETPAYLEFLSDVIRANKILIHYLTIVDLPAS